MAQVLYLNILDPQFTRYIPLQDEIEAYLLELYGEDIDFQVTHENDRWCFRGPVALDRKQIKRMSKEIVKRAKAAGTT